MLRKFSMGIVAVGMILLPILAQADDQYKQFDRQPIPQGQNVPNDSFYPNGDPIPNRGGQRREERQRDRRDERRGDNRQERREDRRDQSRNQPRPERREPRNQIPNQGQYVPRHDRSQPRLQQQPIPQYQDQSRDDQYRGENYGRQEYQDQYDGGQAYGDETYENREQLIPRQGQLDTRGLRPRSSVPNTAITPQRYPNTQNSGSVTCFAQPTYGGEVVPATANDLAIAQHGAMEQCFRDSEECVLLSCQ